MAWDPLAIAQPRDVHARTFDFRAGQQTASPPSEAFACRDGNFRDPQITGRPCEGLRGQAQTFGFTPAQRNHSPPPMSLRGVDGHTHDRVAVTQLGDRSMWDAPVSSPVAGQWDLSPGPVLLAGSDGNVHETRPTTSLARDLLQADATESRHSAQPSLTKQHSFPDERPLQGMSWGREQLDRGETTQPSTRNSSKRLSCPDEQLRGVPRDVEQKDTGQSRHSTPPSSTKRHSCPDERPLRGSPAWRQDFSFSRSASDRPLGGFGAAAAGSSEPASSSTTSRRRSGGTAFASRASSPKAEVSAASGRACRPSAAAGPRHVASRAYAPIERLLALGFDEASARVAMTAAGGDVEKAVRIALEDSQAHDARSLGEWEFEGDRGWLPFDCSTEGIIKDAIARGETACEIRSGGHRYLVDFTGLKQINIATKRTRRIRRRQGA